MGDTLSQAEINALLGGLGDEPDSSEESAGMAGAIMELENELTLEQKDILGEIGNISMGTSATTLFALLGHKVNITIPQVKVSKWKYLAEGYSRPCVGIRVGYKEGLQGSNILVLKQNDVKVIANLMMGGEGNIDEDAELSEIDLSAIGEAMNQMIGSSATSLASMIKMKIDIDTPHAFKLDFTDGDFFEMTGLDPEEIIACTSFRMEIGDLIDSEIMQIIPKEFALMIVDKMRNLSSEPTGQGELPPPPVAAPAPVHAPPPVAAPMAAPPQEYAQQPMYHAPPVQYQQTAPMPPVNVQPVQFQPFDPHAILQQKENIGIIMDVPLEVSVELGRTHKKIKEILEFTPGTIIELNKLAGEPIDILVNGKFVAKGEVVVIDESFGIRVTDIISVEERI
ncbi:MAG: flagellar motor switch phosphatase FliY [Defluviitaleaceae bacterium]|nr:flagellar motor switch phosphatase FliY [Defluviitaleaceae bacterium]